MKLEVLLKFGDLLLKWSGVFIEERLGVWVGLEININNFKRLIMWIIVFKLVLFDE